MYSSMVINYIQINWGFLTSVIFFTEICCIINEKRLGREKAGRTGEGGGGVQKLITVIFCLISEGKVFFIRFDFFFNVWRIEIKFLK